jgi:uridine kinase
MDTTKHLYYVRGVSGSGKTTFAESICLSVQSADDYFTDDNPWHWSKLNDAHDYCKNNVKECMELGITQVAVANTFVKADDYDYYKDLAKNHGYIIHSIIVENRHGGVNIHDVNETSLTKQERRFQVQLRYPNE